MEVGLIFGQAGLWTSIHVLRMMVNNGLATVEDIDAIADIVAEAFDQLPPQANPPSSQPLDVIFADLRQRVLARGQKG